MIHKTGLKRQDNAFALLVGVGDYPHPRFASLPATVRDVQAIATILTDPERCGYPRDNVRAITGPDATVANIRAALESLAQSTNSQSTVFLYFSGHGGRALENGQWRTYLCPREADPGDLAHTALSGDEFTALLAAIPARKLLVMLDACHAAGSAELKAADGTVVWKAGLPDSYYEALSQGTGRVVIASSKEDQFSYIRPQGDLSLFTHHFLQALGGLAAVRGDGLIRVLDVFHYINEAVQADEPKQTPILKVNDLDLNFPIALDRGGKRTRPALAVADVTAVRERIVRDPIAGARALSDYLATRPEWATKRNEVDLKRVELERIQHDLNLFGPNSSDQAAKNRAIYFLLRVCLELEQSQGITIPNGAQVESPSVSRLPKNSESGGESEWNTASIRQFLIAALDDEELTALCYDHFRPVHEGFSSGMSRRQNIQRLLDYCVRHGQLEKLLKLVKERNPTQYERFAPHMASTPTKSVQQNHRVDASVPGRARVGDRIDLIVQVCLPDSPPISIEDWPTKQKPPSIELTSERVDLKFPTDHQTGDLESTSLKIRVEAPDFTIEGSAERLVEVPPDRDSKRIYFLLTPRQAGDCRINVKVHSFDDIWLGTIPLETIVGEVGASSTRTIASLVLVVIVESGRVSSMWATSDAQQDAIWHQRLRDLADNIAQALDLLKQYEDALLYEDDPRRRARCLREIERLRVSAARHRQEYGELRAQVVGEPPAAIRDLVVQLQQVDARLDTLRREFDLQSSTVAPSQPEIFPQITSNILLTDQEKTLLQHVHRNCREVLVEKEFGGGYGGARVLLILPITSDGRRAARKVTKLGAAVELRRERDRYEQYVGPHLPFCVAQVESEAYYEHGDQAGLNYVFVGGGALGKAVVLEQYYRSAFPDAAKRVVKTLNELLGENLGPRWYSQGIPLTCFFAAEYGRHLVEHLRLRLRPESSDRLWPAGQAPQPPTRAIGYRRVEANAIPHEHERIQPGTLLLVEGLLVTRIKRGLVTLEDPDGQGIVVRVDLASHSTAVQGLELGSRVSVRGKVIYNRRNQTGEIIRAIFPDLLPGVDSQSVQLPCEPEVHPSPVYPNPLQIYSSVLGRVLEGRKSYVHGDLHLRNVLVDRSGRGWLIDFARVEERHNLFDFIKMETFLRLTILGHGDLSFSLGDYLRFEEALAASTLGKSVTPPGDPHLRFAYKVILAIRRLARKYVGSEPNFRKEYFPALFLYCLAVTKYYRNDGVQAARLAFATACVQGRYALELDDQAGPAVPTSPFPHMENSTDSATEPVDVHRIDHEWQGHQPDSDQASATHTGSFDIAAIRRQLAAVFDDPGLDAFCMDHFPQVYDKFGRGMRRDEKITLLLDHCRRVPTRRRKLLAALEERIE